MLADQFRDGNVGAQTGLGELVDEAFSALPSGRAWRVSVRSDSAAYQGALLDSWADRGWRFAVSADMTRELRAHIEAVAPDAWGLLAVEPGHSGRLGPDHAGSAAAPSTVASAGTFP